MLKKIAYLGTKEQVAYLINADSVKPMCDLLSVADFNVVVVALEFLENVLAYGEQEKVQGGHVDVDFQLPQSRGSQPRGRDPKVGR